MYHKKNSIINIRDKLQKWDINNNEYVVLEYAVKYIDKYIFKIYYKSKTD